MIITSIHIGDEPFNEMVRKQMLDCFPPLIFLGSSFIFLLLAIVEFIDKSLPQGLNTVERHAVDKYYFGISGERPHDGIDQSSLPSSWGARYIESCGRIIRLDRRLVEERCQERGDDLTLLVTPGNLRISIITGRAEKGSCTSMEGEERYGRRWRRGGNFEMRDFSNGCGRRRTHCRR